LTAGVLQPAAVDLLNPAAAARVGFTGYVVTAQAAGSAAVVDRYTHDLPDADTLDGDAETGWWEQIREFVPGFLAAAPGGAVVRLSTTLSGVADALATLEVPVIARAGSGVLYACFEEGEEACRWVAAAAARGLNAVVEYVPQAGCDGERWPLPGGDFAMIERIKRMFDPDRLLNRGRLYGRL